MAEEVRVKMPNDWKFGKKNNKNKKKNPAEVGSQYIK